MRKTLSVKSMNMLEQVEHLDEGTVSKRRPMLDELFDKVDVDVRDNKRGSPSTSGPLCPAPPNVAGVSALIRSATA